MNNNPILSFLPSFFRTQMEASDGGNLLTPLLEQYASYMGDLFCRAQQCSLIRSIETCPAVILENNKIIDTSVENQIIVDGVQHFSIEDSIIALEGIYLDPLFLNPLEINCYVVMDYRKNKTYLRFDSPIANAQEPFILKVYVKRAYHNPKFLQNFWGRLLGLGHLEYDHRPPSIDPTVPVTTASGNPLASFIKYADQYRNLLIGMLHGLMHGSSIKNMQKSLSISFGTEFAPTSGFLINDPALTNGIGIRNDKNQIIDAKVTSAAMGENGLYIGDFINKYDLLSKSKFTIYDIHTNPSRFTFQLVKMGGKNLVENILKKLNDDDDEKDASLFFDNLLTFDRDGLYWDMGRYNYQLCSDTSEVSNYSTDPGNYFGYRDTRFEHKRVYTLFHNVFIIECSIDAIFLGTDKKKLMVEMIKKIRPAHSRCILIFTTHETAPNGLLYF